MQAVHTSAIRNEDRRGIVEGEPLGQDLASLLLESTKFTTPKESVFALDFAEKNLGISQLKVKS